MDPLSLAVLGGAALNEGIKFLYGQAGEILKRRRERREAAAAGTAQPSEALEVQTPDVLDRPLHRLTIDDEALDRVAAEISELRKYLMDFAEGVKAIDPDDPELLRKADALRQALESVVGQHITFKGEDREPTGTPVVRGSVDVRTLHGVATGAEADEVTEGSISGEVRADVVGEGGEATGTRVRKIGR